MDETTSPEQEERAKLKSAIVRLRWKLEQYRKGFRWAVELVNPIDEVAGDMLYEKERELLALL